ncbi:MAG: MetQ/NlpA family ABC transporter substrate-binding protein [Epulopiscium sp.]|nr:MetQ/NlpA family ABC transporter substrate-binding protein [Candidatus Epulonipiscium sp.]
MKKISLLTIITILAGILLTACGSKGSKANEIKIGVSPVPHSEIIEYIKEDLEKEGLQVTLIEFTDYIKPNHALNDKELDANFFQHGPYFEDFIAKENLKLVSLGNVHIEPMALYSNNHKTVEDLPNGAHIAIPADSVNGGRALLLLESNGLIKLKEGVGLEATEKDIIENPKNIVITALENAQLPRILGDVNGAVINGNYALEAGLNPVSDGLITEGKDSPYANLVAVRAGEEGQDKFVKLLKALQSDKVRQFIEEKYEGAVVPAF